jgi:lipoprotein signal peptidase
MEAQVYWWEVVHNGGAAWPGAHATWSHFGLIGPLVCFFFSYFFLEKNSDARKILAPV